MNTKMLSTELYKIYSKKVIWVALASFLTLYLLLKLQFIDKANVKYTLEPMRPELTSAVENPDFHKLIMEKEYNCTVEDMKPYIPASVFDYIEQYNKNERIRRSLNRDLVNIINNYYERTDNRAAFINELSQDAAMSDNTKLAKAKTKLLQIYQSTPGTIELNLESSANNFIDVNHSALFPCVIMLIILVGLAGIYADEYTSGTLSPLLTSRQGRRGVFFSKLLAATIFIFSIVVFMEAFYMTVTAICYHAPNAAISAASTNGLSLTTYGGTVMGFCFRQISGTLLAAMTLGSIVMCISAYSKNALIPFFIAGIYYGSTAIYANMITFPEYISSIWSLPGELSLFMLQTQVELVDTGHFTNIFGLMVSTLTVNVIFNLILMMLCLMICYKGYTQKEVKN